jgi:hypothetical protein
VRTASRTKNVETADSARQEVAALRSVLAALADSPTAKMAIESALSSIRAAFGWAYGSYWVIDPGARVLRFGFESGSVNPEFEQVTRGATFANGVGLAGRPGRTASSSSCPTSAM